MEPAVTVPGTAFPAAPARAPIEAAGLKLIAETAGYVIDDTQPDFIWYRTPDGARFMPSWTPPEAEEFGPSVALGNFTWDWIYEDYAAWLGPAAWIPGLIRGTHTFAVEAWRG